MLDAFLQHIFKPKYHVQQAALICFPGFCVLPRTAWPQAQKWELVAQINSHHLSGEPRTGFKSSTPRHGCLLTWQLL